MLKEMTITDFCDALASTAPTPGGGGASAASMAIGISIVEMALQLTNGKKGFEDFQDIHTAAITNLGVLRLKALEAIDEDARVFDALMKLYRSKPSEDLKEAHEQALDEALELAGRIPLSVMQIGCDALDIALSISETIKFTVITDLIGGIEMIFGALRSVSLNVAINIDALKDEKRKNDLQYELKMAHEEAIDRYDCLCEILYQDRTLAVLKQP